MRSHIQHIQTQQLSPRGVFSIELCSVYDLTFNDQMGKLIDKLWMVKTLKIFSFLLSLQLISKKIIEIVNDVEIDCRKLGNILLEKFTFASHCLRKNEKNHGKN